MLEMLGLRQRNLLQLLLKNKTGLTVDELSQALDITRNAVRQHLAALEIDGLIVQDASRPSGGRPQHLYTLSPKGKECFPRHYSWFAQLLVESIAQDSGTQALRDQLGKMGKQVAQQLQAQNPEPGNQASKTEHMTSIMQQLGYAASSVRNTDGTMTINADNCIFHTLAVQNPEVCRFDLAMIGGYTDSEVSLEQCIAKGEHLCKFKLNKKTGKG